MQSLFSIKIKYHQSKIGFLCVRLSVTFRLRNYWANKTETSVEATCGGQFWSKQI